MKVHVIDENTKLIAHDEKAVRHYSDVNGIVIGFEQRVELWIKGEMREANITRKWINWETGSIHHIDCVPA